MPKGKYRTARNVGFSSERLAPCIYRILAARAYFHGSSPRMWGTHRLQQHADAVLRFIPTHVGNTLRCSGRSAPSPVHPHACGEHLVSNCSQVARCGSSPRMWGTPEAGRRKLEAHRFIPTHVGNTVGDPPTWAWRPVHPHACGEHGVADMGTFIPGGSSPRMWGTLLAGAEAADLERFIPTHVGNTSGSGPWSLRRAVHLHACGEHGRQMATSTSVLGSSPRMWGTLQHTAFEPAQVRFIPTHVGNTLLRRHRACLFAVHPHACGEHHINAQCVVGKVGSSPRMWGTPGQQLQPGGPLRFIPTHVGNTASPKRPSCTPAVHPHACGEHGKCDAGRS